MIEKPLEQMGLRDLREIVQRAWVRRRSGEDLAKELLRLGKAALVIQCDRLCECLIDGHG